MTPEEIAAALEALRAEFAALDDAALTAEYDRIRTRGQELASQADLSDADSAELDALSPRSTAAVAELDAREARVQAQQAQRDAFATLPERTLSTVVVPTAIQTSQEPAPVPVSEPVAVTAAVVPSVATIAPQEPVQQPGGQTPGVITVSTELSAMARGLLGMQDGDTFTGNNQVGVALIKNAKSFGLAGAPGQRQTIAQFRRNRGEEFTVTSDNGPETMRTLRHARDEKRLQGGSLAAAYQHSVDQGASLTAAAGWCAPSQNDYDLCRNWDAGVGFLDLPTVTVTRGGINYTDEPTFPEIYANAVAAGGGSNFLTEAQVIADTVKTCSELPCPTFENRRLDVLALCIRVSFLQAAGYPEVIDAWDDGLRAAHEAEQNRIIIADIIARAGAATVLDNFGTTDDSFTSGVLAAVELAAEDTRYRFHMAWNATVEVALPHWIIPQIRADLSRRTGDTGNLLAVSDSQIASLFTARGVRPHWVRGWQDGLVTGGALNAAYPGGIAAPPFLTALPSTAVQFLSWPAGSIAVARQDVVTLTNVYDAASLSVNEFTSLFAEEGFAPIYPCPGQRLYTVNDLCVGGTTGEAQIRCSAPAA